MLQSNLNDHSKLTAFGESFDQIEELSPKNVSTLTRQQKEGFSKHTKSPEVHMAKQFLMH